MTKTRIYASHEISPQISHVAESRIRNFSEFPYLYIGTTEYEAKYLEGYARERDALLATVEDSATILGFVTGMPLATDSEIVADIQSLLPDPESYFYLGEFIVEKEYRGQGLSRVLDLAIESEARTLGFQKFCLLTVARDDGDPRMPDGYKPTHPLWKKLGFEKTDIQIRFDWPTIGVDKSVSDVSNPMDLWVKED